MNRTVRIAAAAVISIAAFWIFQVQDRRLSIGDADAEIHAARLMEQAIQAVREARERAGVAFDPSIDPNRTGLIGSQYSPLVTTVGDLEAKRTTTNPNLAGLLVSLLGKAGVKSGDTVAIGSSGSFPALLLASLAAAKAMAVQPIVILSLGASSFGATDPDFNLLDMYDFFRRERLCTEPPAAVSLGGDQDTGIDLDASIRDRLTKRIQAERVAFLNEPILERNVAARMRIYRSAARGKIAAFINCGGGYANLGTSPLVLNVKPGVNTGLTLPPPSERGMLLEMAARGIPVIHLLYIKGLAQQAALPWDPIPLPHPEALHGSSGRRSSGFWLVCLAYFGLLVLLVPRRR